MLGNFFYFNSLHFISLLAHTLWYTFTDVVGRLHVSSPAGQTDNKGGVFPVWAGASGIGIAY